MTSRPLILGLLTAWAATALAAAAQADPPGRVGRVADIEGGVSMLPTGSQDWIWASRNYPVAPGESFWTGDDGRARLQIGATDARLDSETELDVVDLDYGAMRLALPQGSLDLRLWASPRGGVTIATPAGDVHLDGRGLYRIDVGAPQADGAYPPVELTVFEGRAEAPSPEGPVLIYPGQAAVIYAGYDPQLQGGQDADIDDWGRELEARSAWRPVDDAAAAVTGLGDLAAAGDYAMDPLYGRVWFPRGVAPDWAPYRYGHWAYVEPWGYTWIDDQPWGFAPFHYGRWAQIGGRWGWIAGQPTPEPVYAPALVAFVGGVGWNVGGADAIGWAPLAPDEVYRPNYAVSVDYVRRVNVNSVRPTIINTVIVNNTIINRTTVYRNVSAVTVVRAAAFSGAAPVHRSIIPVTAEVIARAPPASPATRPPPQAAARAGFIRPEGEAGGGGTRAAPTLAARPPAILRATHAAIAAPPVQGGRPPPIAGARIGPPPPRPAPGGSAAAVIAPAQAHRSQAPGGGSMAPREPAASMASKIAPGPTPARPMSAPPARPQMAAPQMAAPKMAAPIGAPASSRFAPGSQPPVAAVPARSTGEPAIRPPTAPTPSREPPPPARMKSAQPAAEPGRPPALQPETSRPPSHTFDAPAPSVGESPAPRPRPPEAPTPRPPAPAVAPARARPPEAAPPRPQSGPPPAARPKPGPEPKKREGAVPNP